MQFEMMTRENVEQIISSKIKLIRVEQGYSQEKMADLLGLSKKTLVQIEKGRVKAGWTLSLALCALFRESEILQSSLGGDPLDVLKALAAVDWLGRKEKTMGGKIWWKLERSLGRFRLQRNMVSGHYRILDDEDYRWSSSFDKDYIVQRFEELAGEKEL